MLTAEQRKVFEDLLKDKNFRGKDSLNHLLWLNTTNPKHSIGDCFLVTDPGHKVFGHKVVNFHGKITKVSVWRTHEEYSYELEGVVRTEDGRETTTKFYKGENDLTVPCEDNITLLGDSKSLHADVLDVPLNI